MFEYQNAKCLSVYHWIKTQKCIIVNKIISNDNSE